MPYKNVEDRKKYYELNKERILKQQKEYQKKNKDLGHNRWIKYQKEQKVRQKINNLVRTKKIVSAKLLMCMTCFEIGCNYHHENYNKPYCVTILCPKCHNDIHIKSRLYSTQI